MEKVKKLLERGWARAKEIPWNPATVVLAVVALGVLGLALELLAQVARIAFYAAVAVGIGYVIWRFACVKQNEIADGDDEPESVAWWQVFGS